jgi:hypothetical protein
MTMTMDEIVAKFAALEARLAELEKPKAEPRHAEPKGKK